MAKGANTYMKRKAPVKEMPVVAPEILEAAHRSIGEERKRAQKCDVCASEVAPNSTEQLCWVCRRLKISAWRDADLQASAGE